MIGKSRYLRRIESPSEIVDKMIKKNFEKYPMFTISDNNIMDASSYFGKVDMGIESGITFNCGGPQLSRVELAERELDSALEAEKVQNDYVKQQEKITKEVNNRRALAFKTLEEAAAGKITKNCDTRVEAAEALLNH